MIYNNDGSVTLRKDTKANWESVNPVLEAGELVIEVDGAITKLKAGDGVTAYKSLPFVSGGDLNLDAMYPVGAIYVSTVATSPATLFGGTWEALPAGRVLLAQGTSDWGTTYSAGSTGGEAAHTLTIGEMPSHRHVGLDIDNVYIFGWDNGSLKGFDFQQVSINFNTANRLTTGYTGDGAAHNNMQPFLSVFMWKRTA